MNQPARNAPAPSQSTAIQKAHDPAKAVHGLLLQMESQIQAALPRHMTAERMVRIVLTEVRKNPELAMCDQKSFMGAIVQCSQLGLEPGSALGHAFLIPFNNRKRGIKEVNVIIGYKGLVDLTRRSGQVESLVARPVFEADEFVFEFGDDETIRHSPFRGPRKDRGDLTHVYAIARFKGGGIQREVMSRADVDYVRDNYSHGNPVWKSDYEEMARKTAVRKLAKYLPLSPELRDAIRLEDGAVEGSQENWRTIDADYEPPAQVVDAGKFAEVSAAKDAPMATEKAAAGAPRQVAMKEFLSAYEACQKADIDIDKAIGFKPILETADERTLTRWAVTLQAALGAKP